MKVGMPLGILFMALCFGATAQAQFASDRASKPVAPAAVRPAPVAPVAQSAPLLPSGIEPVSHITAMPKSASQMMLPNGVTLPDPRKREELKQVPTTTTEDAVAHPWAVKVETGPWMICVKSYTGMHSRTLAEKLATDLRTTHKVGAYLFERNAEERRSEKARVEAIRQVENAKAQPFIMALEQAKKDSAANGMIFMEDKAKIKVPVPYHESPEQWAVLIGPFASMEDASKMLPAVKKLPAPKDESLCDRELIGGEEKDAKTGKVEWKSAYNLVNPYATAFVSRNPALGATKREEKRVEPFLIELNKDLKHSLLKVQKPYTILVKAYTTPTRPATLDGKSSVFTKTQGSSTADILKATAVEAENLCEALRDPGMKPRVYESYVFHHRNGSFVTVGGFDAPDDPVLLQLQEELKGITFAMCDEKKKPILDREGKPVMQRLFNIVHPCPVPKP